MNIEENKIISEEHLFLFPFNYKYLSKLSILCDAEKLYFRPRTFSLTPIQNENSCLTFDSYYKNISRF